MRRNLYYILILFLLLSVTHCSNEAEEDNSGEEKVVSIILNLSENASDRKSKAMTDEDENKINTIDILAFVNNGGNYEYKYRTKGTDFVYQSATTGMFKAMLKTGNQAFVIIVNATQEVNNAISSTSQNDGIDVVLSKITVQNTGKWDTDTPKAIPMYSKILADISGTTASIGSAETYLVRMLARIDIINTAQIFELTDAFLFKPMDKGSVTYSDQNWDASNLKVKKPEVPVNATQIQVSLEYDASNEIMRTIYTFESPAIKEPTTATAVVVGGYYDYPNNTSKKTYYRIDIPPTEAGFFNGDIVRNYLYKINIDNVSEEGARNKETAYNEINAKLEATISAWNNAKIGTIIDGQYYLYVDKPGIIIPPQGSNEVVSVLTDHPEGISVIQISPMITSVSGGRDGDKARRLSIRVGPYNGPSRTGYVTIKAGNMRYAIKVVQ